MFNFFNNQQDLAVNKATENEFTDKFTTLQKARKDLIGEIEAIMHYDEHLHSTTNMVAQETWDDIKNEELTHVGELLGLLNYLDPSQQDHVKQGYAEFMGRLKNR